MSNRPVEPQIVGKKSVQPPANKDREQIAQLAKLSMRQRGEMVESACRAAFTIHRSLLNAGLAPVPCVPWPESTWEFLKTYARDVSTDDHGVERFDNLEHGIAD
jgi:hypothetical protein